MSNPPAPDADLIAGAATVDITPAGSVFLFGYPHVPRLSTGVHDPLQCSALYLRRAESSVLFLANDLIFISGEWGRETRRRISAATGVPSAGILLSATHTHSGPVTADMLSNAADAVVPKADPRYLAALSQGMVEAATRAVAGAVPAEIGLVTARAEGVGTNRHDPAGPSDPEVPVLLARDAATGKVIAGMLVYAMHPTVLHEDSTAISGDFPYFTRRYLRQAVLPPDCPILYHCGASGDQSPRYMTRGNTLAEAERLGENLGRAIAGAIPGMAFHADVRLRARQGWLELEPRVFPRLEEARRRLDAVRACLARLQQEGAARTQVRTAECDVFGAEATAELARAAEDGRVAAVVARCSPAEIQAIEIGPWTFVGWPGEFFVEYALELRRQLPGAYVITMANGELQGYIVTEEAAARGVYESTNAVFAPENGGRFVEATVALLGRTRTMRSSQ